MKPSPYHPVHIALGLVLWAVWFAALYGGLAVACELAPPAVPGRVGSLNVGFGLFTLAAAIVLAAFAWGCAKGARDARDRPGAERFVARVGAAVYVVALGATLFIAVPLLQLPPCV